MFSTNRLIWKFSSSMQLQVLANNNDMVVNLNKTKEIVMGPPSKTSHLPPLQISAGHVERVNSVKSLGINNWMQIFRGSHTSRPSRPRQLETLFSKTTQACGCSPSPVAPFLHRGNQACTGICRPSLESLAYENTN